MERTDDRGGHPALDYLDYIALAGLACLTLWAVMNKHWWLIVVLGISTAYYTIKECRGAQ